jgi:hypothetical protein
MVRRMLGLEQRETEPTMRRAVVRPFRQGEIATPVRLLCDGYLVEGATSLRELVDIVGEKSVEHPGRQLIATLDDFDQACDASAHTIETCDLDRTDGHDLSSVDSTAFKNGEHLGYLSTKSEFFIRRQNVMRHVADMTFVDACGKLSWGPDRRGRDFFSLNANPGAMLDSTICIQIVPVAHACEAVCAFPNGYFSDDLNPFEMYEVAKHLEEHYDYRLFGIGASYLGFLKGAGRSDAAVDKALATDLLTLFGEARNKELAVRVARLVSESPHLFFKYTAH